MNLTVTQNINQINVTVTQSNTVIELQPVLNNTGAGSGGGAVDSVNGQTGVVVLTADNIPETGTKFWLTDILKTAYDSTVTWIATNGINLLNHLTNFSNPHNVTASQIGAPSGSGTSTGVNTGDNATNSQYSGLAASKEDTSNKSNSDADIASTIKFPTWNAIWTKALSFFQETLVSGTNIKTLNGESLLGSGNIVIGGSSTNKQIFHWFGGNWSTGVLDRYYYIGFNGGAIEGTTTTINGSMNGRNKGLFAAPFDCKIKRVIFKEAGSGSYTGAFVLASGLPKYNETWNLGYGNVVTHLNEVITAAGYEQKKNEFLVTDDITVPKGYVVCPMLVFSAQAQAGKNSIEISVEIEEVI